MMKKTYLNRNEKTIVITLASFSAYLQDRIDEWQKHKTPDKELLKYTRMTNSFLGKIMDKFMLGLDHSETYKMLGKSYKGVLYEKGEVHKMECVVKYKDDAIRDYEKMKTMDSVTPVETEDLLAVIELGLVSCSVCESCGTEAQECRFRKIFFKYDIEPMNCEAEPDRCPYQAKQQMGDLETGVPNE